jgi:hypothetical protein
MYNQNQGSSFNNQSYGYFYNNNTFNNNNNNLQNYDYATYNNNYIDPNQVASPITPNTSYQHGYFNDSFDNQSFDNNYQNNTYYNPVNNYNYQYYNSNSTLDGSFINYANNSNSNNIAQSSNMTNSYDNIAVASTSSSFENSSISTSLSPKPSTENLSNKTNKTRNTIHHQLPEEAVELLNEWFESHINHPYPTTEEKQRLADDCGITTKQVNSWFCNRRNRSQNTKPKRIKRQLEKEISNVFNELVQNPNRTQKVIEKIRNTLMMHDIGIINNNNNN